MQQHESVVTQEHIDSLVEELAKAAGITPQQAQKVLELMHVDKLAENIVAMQQILRDETATNALGFSREDVAVRRKVVSAAAFKLENLRVGIKPVGIAGVHA